MGAAAVVSRSKLLSTRNSAPQADQRENRCSPAIGAHQTPGMRSPKLGRIELSAGPCAKQHGFDAISLNAAPILLWPWR